jgi:hypothetical protein
MKLNNIICLFAGLVLILFCIGNISALGAFVDLDSDGVDDYIDNCKPGNDYRFFTGRNCTVNYSQCYNPDQRDSDGDLIGNLCDPCPSNYSANNATGCVLTGTSAKYVTTSDGEIILNNTFAGNGYVEIIIPAGALKSNTTIALQRMNVLASGNLRVSGVGGTVLSGNTFEPNGILLTPQ